MNTKDAERLLKEAKHDPGCNADEPGGDCCPGCGYVTASTTIQNMAADSLAVAITLAAALQALDGLWINHDRKVHADNYMEKHDPEERPLGCPTCKALAAWEAL
jgi:hypothetical protein